MKKAIKTSKKTFLLISIIIGDLIKVNYSVTTDFNFIIIIYSVNWQHSASGEIIGFIGSYSLDFVVGGAF